MLRVCGRADNAALTETSHHASVPFPYVLQPTVRHILANCATCALISFYTALPLLPLHLVICLSTAFCVTFQLVRDYNPVGRLYEVHARLCNLMRATVGSLCCMQKRDVWPRRLITAWPSDWTCLSAVFKKRSGRPPLTTLELLVVENTLCILGTPALQLHGKLRMLNMTTRSCRKRVLSPLRKCE